MTLEGGLYLYWEHGSEEVARDQNRGYGDTWDQGGTVSATINRRTHSVGMHTSNTEERTCTIIVYRHCHYITLVHVYKHLHASIYTHRQ